MNNSYENLETQLDEMNVELREFLKEGNKISSRFVTGSEWITNTVLEVDKNAFETNLKVSYVINNISCGDVMIFKYCSECYEYVMNGCVEDINLYENTMTMVIRSVKKYSNKRKDMRYDVSLCSYITTNNSQKPIYALIRNISRGGASLESKSDIELGEEVGLKIFLSKNRIITLIVKILRKRASQTDYIYDIKFITITNHSRELFDELMSVLENYDDDIFYNYIRSLNN